MLGIYDYKTLIKGVMKSQVISSYRKAELRFEVYSLCLNAYNDNIIFYYLCAESLMDIGDYEKAENTLDMWQNIRTLYPSKIHPEL